jgi:hypothetical protein
LVFFQNYFEGVELFLIILPVNFTMPVMPGLPGAVVLLLAPTTANGQKRKCMQIDLQL